MFGRDFIHRQRAKRLHIGVGQGLAPLLTVLCRLTARHGLWRTNANDARRYLQKCYELTDSWCTTVNSGELMFGGLPLRHSCYLPSR